MLSQAMMKQSLMQVSDIQLGRWFLFLPSQIGSRAIFFRFWRRSPGSLQSGIFELDQIVLCVSGRRPIEVSRRTLAP